MSLAGPATARAHHQQFASPTTVTSGNSMTPTRQRRTNRCGDRPGNRHCFGVSSRVVKPDEHDYLYADGNQRNGSTTATATLIVTKPPPTVVTGATAVTTTEQRWTRPSIPTAAARRLVRLRADDRLRRQATACRRRTGHGACGNRRNHRADAQHAVPPASCERTPPRPTGRTRSSPRPRVRRRRS